MSHADDSQPPDLQTRKNKPSVRRACVACHTGKTRCSEVLPCQNCLKRGLGSLCAYAVTDPDTPASSTEQPQTQHRDERSSSVSAAAISTGSAPNPAFAPPPPAYPTMQPFYDYSSGSFANTTFPSRPAKRPRPLTDDETAAITRNFTRGDFFVGNNAPVRIDPRLPVRLTLGEGDQVHFNIGNYEPGL
ncbi:hypothetical protein C8F01DRAFT_1165659 [Mycena amicta]|nr:hypothetical protein C8F01DRAFT_1165659 [Mycena amicta]